MYRWIIAGIAMLSGCGESVSPLESSSGLSRQQEVGEKDSHTAALVKIQQAIIEPKLEAAAESWPVVMPYPVDVPQARSFRCFVPIEEQNSPHFKPAIVIRTNPESLEAFQTRQSPMPVGTVVLKEKHEELDASDAPNEFGAMIKREPGYDSEHGDWEYVYGVISPDVQVERGKLANCIACHEAYAKQNDYLFRSYLPDKSEPAEATPER